MKNILVLIASLLVLSSCVIDSKLFSNPNNKVDTKTNESKLKYVPVSQVQAIPDTFVIEEGNKVRATASVIYIDNTRNSDLIWSSSDDTLAVVNSTTGEISGVRPGIVTITATSQRDNTKRASITVTVKRAEVVEAITKIEPKEATIKVGETTRFNAKIQMSDGTISPNVIWKTDNTAIALVSDGLVTGIAEGTTTITAIAEGDSTKRAFAKITVIKDTSNK